MDIYFDLFQKKKKNIYIYIYTHTHTHTHTHTYKVIHQILPLELAIEALDMATSNLDKAVYISHSANILEKGMNSTILPPAMSK